MKLKRTMLQCIPVICVGTAIYLSALADAMADGVAPPPKPDGHTTFSLTVTPGEFHEEKDKVRHGHHHKGDIGKNKSRDDSEYDVKSTRKGDQP